MPMTVDERVAAVGSLAGGFQAWRNAGLPVSME